MTVQLCSSKMHLGQRDHSNTWIWEDIGSVHGSTHNGKCHPLPTAGELQWTTVTQSSEFFLISFKRGGGGGGGGNTPELLQEIPLTFWCCKEILLPRTARAFKTYFCCFCLLCNEFIVLQKEMTSYNLLDTCFPLPQRLDI